MSTKRLLPVSGKEMVRVFSKIGFKVERKRGSHIIIRELIKDAGLTVEAFNALLKGKK